MYALALSVGHNSSAIAIKDGEILGGYEEERFTLKKADSSFPINAIMELNKRFSLPSDVSVCVSHWFPDGILPAESKYFSHKTIFDLFPKSLIYTLDANFTHHDAHMRSAHVFAGETFPKDCHVFVIDGFGNFGECVSIYQNKSIIAQTSGYKNSLGLFFQYATAYCGMKMHQDEYKMLAYETHLAEIVPISAITDINEYIDVTSCAIWGEMCAKSTPENSLAGLAETLEFVNSTLGQFLLKFSKYVADERSKRILVSYFAQRHLQNIVYSIVNAIRPKNLIVTGGVFLNVKINHMLANSIDGLFCAMPLAGDQGAGLGVYQHYFGDLKWPEHLFWGHRNFDMDRLNEITGIVRAYRGPNGEWGATYDAIYRRLRTHGYVNLVRGPMEFGPRALCNTSTLALPTLENAALINRMNARTNEMPFAMVVTPKQCKGLFLDTEKIHKSLEYMIVTREFRSGYQRGREGGAHYYPLSDTFTCRPQVTTEPVMTKLLEEFGPLINTSWNYHGVPIVRGVDDIIFTHEMEQKAAPDLKITTVVEAQ